MPVCIDILYFNYCIQTIHLFIAELVVLGDWWSNTRIIFYTDRKDYDTYFGKEHAYCIMNHTFEVDWLIGWMIADRIHLLGVS